MTKKAAKKRKKADEEVEKIEPIDELEKEEFDEENSEDDGASPSKKTLEARYAKQMRQVFLQKIEIPIKLLPEMATDSLELSPSFQRRDVWDPKKQSRFVESIIMNVPIPPVFLRENEYGHYVVLDGRQRLTAILDYMNGSYDLTGLQVWADLNGLRFAELKARNLDVTLTRRFVPAILLLKESSTDLQYDVFDRLNTGGVIAEKMEIRNAVFRGKFTDQLKIWADSVDFRRLFGIPLDDLERRKNSKTYQRMRDLEIVLRLLALADRKAYEEEGLVYQDYLSLYMKTRNVSYEEDASLVAADHKRFSNGIANILTVFGVNAFIRTEGTSLRSAPLADALFAALCERDAAEVKANKEKIKAGLEQLRGKTAYKNALTRGTNGRGAVRERIGKSVAAVDAALA
jgi:hypothetical protein